MLSVLALLHIVGAGLLGHFSGRFVFDHAGPWMRMALWSSAVLVPLVIFLMADSRAFTKQLAIKTPTTSLRNGIVIPLCALAAVGLFFAGPLGWYVGVMAWSGGPVQHVGATAIDVGAHGQAKGCDQSATLRILSADEKTCLDGLYPPGAMRPGERLDVGIIVSPIGFLIVSMSGTSAPRESGRPYDVE
ncbi:hypothetical protein [Pseudoduganella lutea]|uniref:Uncharacterized protein n=1 Tax=Pseudoduganella lutea TaxID=321985 RepID=A0A4P6KT54_9BURK|nr:hypothetical protein [Pseudoduganella lutea]QBE62299.1 hypothetical protein EWM63_04285 [Pseudoduganella lutea]